MGSKGKEREEKQEKKCFIITPIGDSNFVIFRKVKGVIESVIRPVLQENGFNNIKAAYEFNNKVKKVRDINLTQSGYGALCVENSLLR